MLWRLCVKPVLLAFTFGNSRLEQIATPINLVRFPLLEPGSSRLICVGDKDTFSDYWPPITSGRRFPQTSSQTTGSRLSLIPEKTSGLSRQSEWRTLSFGFNQLMW